MAPDPEAMTPEDRQTFQSATQAISGASETVVMIARCEPVASITRPAASCIAAVAPHVIALRLPVILPWLFVESSCEKE